MVFTWDKSQKLSKLNKTGTGDKRIVNKSELLYFFSLLMQGTRMGRCEDYKAFKNCQIIYSNH